MTHPHGNCTGTLRVIVGGVTQGYTISKQFGDGAPVHYGQPITVLPARQVAPVRVTPVLRVQHAHAQIVLRVGAQHKL